MLCRNEHKRSVRSQTMKILKILEIGRAPRIRAFFDARRGNVGLWENRELKPPREKPRRGGTYHNGGMGASTPINMFKRGFHGKTSEIKHDALGGSAPATQASSVCDSALLPVPHLEIFCTGHTAASQCTPAPNAGWRKGLYPHDKIGFQQSKFSKKPGNRPGHGSVRIPDKGSGLIRVVKRCCGSDTAAFELLNP